MPKIIESKHLACQIEVNGIPYDIYAVGPKDPKKTASSELPADFLNNIQSSLGTLSELSIDKALFTEEGVYKLKGKTELPEKIENSSFQDVTKAVGRQSFIAINTLNKNPKWQFEENDGPHPWTIEKKLLAKAKQFYPKSLSLNNHTNFYAFVRIMNIWASSEEITPYKVRYNIKHEPIFLNQEALIRAYSHYEEYITQNQGNLQILNNFEQNLQNDLDTGSFSFKKAKHNENMAGLFASCDNMDRFRSIGFDIHMQTETGETFYTKIRQQFLPNSDLNGLKYFNTDTANGTSELVTIKNAFNSSYNRDALNAHVPRAIIDKTQNKSLCYAGRIKSQKTAEEIIPMMFEKELQTRQKGIVQVAPNEYEFSFCVHSLLTSFVPEERRMFQQECAALQDTQTIRYQNDEDQTITIHCKPLIINTGINPWHKRLKWLYAAPEIEHNRLEITKLRSLITLRKNEFGLKNGPSQFEYNMLSFLNQKIETALATRFRTNEDAIIASAMLFQMLNLPALIHCKSSVDRTGQTIAVYSALDQWLDIENDKGEQSFQARIAALSPDSPGFNTQANELFASIQHNDLFKELFLSNWLSSQEIASYARIETGYKNFQAMIGCFPDRLPRKKKLLERELQRILRKTHLIAPNSPASDSSQKVSAFLFSKKTGEVLKNLGKRHKSAEKPNRRILKAKLKRVHSAPSRSRMKA